MLPKEYIVYSKGYKYQLRSDYNTIVKFRPIGDVAITDFLRLDSDGNLLIRRGYAWDGASGPTIDTDDSMRGSLVHDAGYQLIRLKLVSPEQKEIIDFEFYRILIEDGMNENRAKAWLYAVRQFGKTSILLSAEPRLLVAPKIEASDVT